MCAAAEVRSSILGRLGLGGTGASTPLLRAGGGEVVREGGGMFPFPFPFPWPLPLPFGSADDEAILEGGSMFPFLFPWPLPLPAGSVDKSSTRLIEGRGSSAEGPLPFFGGGGGGIDAGAVAFPTTLS